MTVEFNFQAVFDAIEAAKKKGIGHVFNVECRDDGLSSTDKADIEDAFRYFLIENAPHILRLFDNYMRNVIQDNINTLEELKR